jgi:beta-glucosidase
MNLTAKLGMMRGYGAVSDAPDYTRNSGCGGVCGRPQSKNTAGDITAGTFRWDNGPQGVSSANHEGPAGNSTQWPSTLNMAATWDPTLALEWGTAMGLEFWNKGANIQEGPGINVLRAPKNGRTFEYVSGEDPVLGSKLVVPIVEGIQRNVMAIAKHYILNNQEDDRSGVNEM